MPPSSARAISAPPAPSRAPAAPCRAPTGTWRPDFHSCHPGTIRWLPGSGGQQLAFLGPAGRGASSWHAATPGPCTDCGLNETHPESFRRKKRPVCKTWSSGSRGRLQVWQSDGPRGVPPGNPGRTILPPPLPQRSPSTSQPGLVCSSGDPASPGTAPARRTLAVP